MQNLQMKRSVRLTRKGVIQPEKPDLRHNRGQFFQLSPQSCPCTPYKEECTSPPILSCTIPSSQATQLLQEPEPSQAGTPHLKTSPGLQKCSCVLTAQQEIQVSLKQRNREDSTMGKKKCEHRAHTRVLLYKSAEMIYGAAQSTSTRPALHKARSGWPLNSQTAPHESQLQKHL